MKTQKVSQRRIFQLGFLISICLLIDYQVSYGQNMLEKWIATVSTGIEKHDKRLFDYSEKKMLLEMQPEEWGTYHFDMIVKRRVWQHNNFYSFIGLGLGYEKATFLRPFNHRYFEKGIALDILRNLNRYKKISAPLSLSLNYGLGANWFIVGEIRSNILLYRNIDHTENNTGPFPYKAGTFELDKIILNVGINYKIGQFLVGFNSRVLNFQKIDKIIFNHYLKDPRIDQKWEWYNPLRFDFTVAYMW